MKLLRPFWIAMQLLTRLPVPDSNSYDAASTGRSLLFYPLVGALIGAVLAGAGWLLAPHVSPLPLAALLLVFWVMLTGALHLDGLADSADGWLGGLGNRKRTLEIMHDPRSGPAAIVAIVLVLLMKFSALAAIVKIQSWYGLLSVPLLGRSLVPLLFLTTPCARPDGMAASLAAHLPRRSAWLAVAFGLSAVALAVPTGAWLILAGLLLFSILRRMMLARIGGMTGDTIGALVELTEAVALIVFVVCADTSSSAVKI